MKVSITSRTSWAIPFLIIASLIFVLGWSSILFSEKLRGFFVYCQTAVLFQLNHNPILLIVAFVAGLTLVAGFIRMMIFIGSEILRSRKIINGLGLLRLTDSRGMIVVDAPDAIAFTIGLFRPRIVVTTALRAQLSEIEFQSIIAHEEGHVERRDPLRRLLGKCIAELVFFLPIASDLFDNMVHHQECRADRRSIIQYGQTPLLSGMNKLLSSALDRSVGTTVCGAVSVTDRVLRMQRVDSAFAFDFSVKNIASTLVLAGIVICSPLLTSPAEARSAEPQVCQAAFDSLQETRRLSGPMNSLYDVQTTNIDSDTFIILQSFRK